MIETINAAVLCTPIVIGVAWWIWLHDRTILPRWRVHLVLTSLMAVSVNALVYYAWLAHSILASGSDSSSVLKNTLGTYIAVPLTILALGGAIVGKGTARVLLLFSALTGFFFWVGVGIL